jgi:hypothetical protein
LGSPDTALAVLLCAVRRSVTVRVSVAPKGIAGLVSFGWLDARQILNPALIADAIVDVVDTALDAGLRPAR